MAATAPPQHVVVVGGGISGLATAAHLADRGVAVTVLEAGSEVGGQLRTVEVAGRAVDVGAESLHTGAPGVLELLRRVDLEAEAVDAAPGPTWIATTRGPRRLPAGVGPAGPSRLWPVVTSRVLSPRGLLRAAAEPFVAGGHPGHDVAVGSYLTRRFGPELTERLVDPLLGNLHAGDVDRLSLAATVPQLDRTARAHRSLVLARRRAPGAPPARFVTVPGGLTRIAAALAADPRLAVRRDVRVAALGHDAGRYRVTTDVGAPIHADAVVLAVPAAEAARLIAPLHRIAGQLLGRRETASVATVVVAFDRREIADQPLAGANGLLLPSGTGRTLKTATVLTNKWPHLDTGDGRVLLRLSAGRAGDDRLVSRSDDELVQELRHDLAETAGITATPTATVVQRWHDTMPQLTVGHVDELATLRRLLEGGGERVEVVGAAYDGVGIASCLRAAQAAAGRLLTSSSPEVAA